MVVCGCWVEGQAPAPKKAMAQSASETRLQATKIPSRHRLFSLGAWYALQRSARRSVRALEALGDAVRG